MNKRLCIRCNEEKHELAFELSDKGNLSKVCRECTAERISKNKKHYRASHYHSSRLIKLSFGGMS